MHVAMSGPGVRRAVHSVLSQNYTELELVVVDSTADDQVSGLLRAIQDPRVRRVPVSGEATPAAALNAGIRAASGEIVGFQDATTEWLPLKLEVQLAVLAAEPTVEFVGGGWIGYSDGCAWSATPAGLMRATPPDPNPLECASLPLAAWIVRRAALRECGSFDPKLAALQEWDLALRLLGRGKARFVFDNVALLHRPRPDEALLRSDVQRTALAELLRRHAAVFGRQPALLAGWQVALGRPVPPPAASAAAERDLALTTEGPLVTVVMPTHNRARLLRRAIISILTQSYRNLELIVVDDASTDDTNETVRAFADPRLRYIRLDHNRRAAAARNIGIREAKGELIAFQDDDDIWMPQKLAIQVAALQAAPAHVGLNLCSHIQLSTVDTLYVGGAERFKWIDFSRGMDWRFGMIATPAWLARRQVLLDAGLFDEGMKAWDDWEYALRLKDLCDFSFVPEPLFIQDQRRIPGSGMWDNQKVYANDMGIIMRRHGARWAKQPRVLASHYLVLGLSEFTFHSRSAGRKWFLESLRARPLQFKAPAYLLLSWLGPGAISVSKRLTQTLRRWYRRALGVRY
ncbi:MAG: glycosyltransferase family A protein [Pseudomonadota bacterium]